MKKYSVLILFLCSAFVGFCQQAAEFSWGVSLYPNFSDRRLIAFSNISEREVFSLDSFEVAKPSYSAGLFAGWKGNKAGFQFGINFMDTGYRTLRGPIPEGEPNPNEATERRFVYQNYNIEVPIEVLFLHELNPKMEFAFMMGGSFSVNLQNRVKTIFYTGESKEVVAEDQDNSLFRTTNYAFQTGMGVERSFGDSFSLILRPTFQFWLRGVLKDNELNRNLYSFGLKVGARFK